MRVDQYTATVGGSGSEALAWVLEALPAGYDVSVGQDGAVRRYCYEHAVPLVEGRSVLAVVRWGGNGGGVSVELKGQIAHETYGLLRARWPVHAMTRCDVAVDGTGPGLFDAVIAACEAEREALPANRRPRLGQQGDWSGLEPRTGGRSAYYGGNGLLVVIYEKGWEREARAGAVEQDRDWVRMELRVQPARKEVKRALSGIEPSELWGLGDWSARWLEIWQGQRPARVQLPSRQSDDDRTYGALLAQYGAWLLAHPERLAALEADLRSREALRLSSGRRSA